MALIEEVKEMQMQGLSDAEISQKLQERGFNPREIEDSINQSKIKSAVSGSDYEQNGQESIINSEMQPSITSQEQPPQQGQQAYYYPQEQYPPQEYYQPPQQQGISPETISEIAEQIVSERISDLKKIISILVDSKAVMESRVASIDLRLKKIESVIDKIQESILEKVGEYGRAVEDIKSEVYGMEESFSKVINPLVEKARHEIKKEKSEKPIHSEQELRKPKKSKDNFENYLR